MKTTISLRQLRNDPRQLVRLINDGYTVSITEHRKVLATAGAATRAKQVNTKLIAETIKQLPAVSLSDKKDLSYKQARLKALNKKYSRV